MEMHQVRYFLAAARTLNFTRAADECHISQPSLTRAIQKLEEEFGGQLFRRERAFTHLTELGKLMVPHLERSLEAAEAAKTLAKGVGTANVTPLSLGVGLHLGGGHFEAAIAEVGGSLPGFQVSLLSGTESEVLARLLHGDLDLAILGDPRETFDRLDRIVLFTQRYAIAAPYGHRLLQAVNVSIGDLRDVSWIETTGEIFEDFRDRLRSAGVEPDLRHSAGTLSDARNLLAAGLGCVLLPRDQSLPDGAGFVDLTGLNLQRPVVLLTVSGRKRAVASDAFIRAARARSWE